MKTTLASLFALILATLIVAPSVMACPRTQNSYGPPWYNDAWADHMPAKYYPDRGQPFREQAKADTPSAKADPPSLQESKPASAKEKRIKMLKRCIKPVVIYHGSKPKIRTIVKDGCLPNHVHLFSGTRRKVRVLNRTQLQPAKTDPPVAQPQSTADQVAPPPHMNLVEVYFGNRKALMIVK